jgi:CarD family transcriptional regulator
MAQGSERFKNGDWIVHPSYGVGRIKKVERKRLDGQQLEYFRVEAHETAYWIPLDGMEESRARKVISQADFRKAVRLLENPPRQMDESYKKRRKRINEVLSEGLLRPTIRLVRDLWARNHKKRLNDTEKGALRRIMDTLVDEWAITEGISPEEANAQLNELLDRY